MKPGAWNSPKHRRLARELKIEPWGAAGILEGLWLFTAAHAPRGDIGRWSDADIAEAIGWSGAAGKLVAALVTSGWLDQSPQYRLIVHDWSDHAEDRVHTALARQRLHFADGKVPSVTRHLHSQEREIVRKWYDDNPFQPDAVEVPGSRQSVGVDSLPFPSLPYDTKSLSGADAPAKKRGRKQQPQTTCPDALNADQWASIYKWRNDHHPRFSDAELRAQWLKCRDWHTSKGNLRADWPATLRTWMTSDNYKPITPTGTRPTGQAYKPYEHTEAPPPEDPAEVAKAIEESRRMRSQVGLRRVGHVL